jgi:hypothetical protein
MTKTLLLLTSLFILQSVTAQKKPLDHTVYDGWQNIGDRMISNNGKWIVYSINVQEGDNELVIQSADASYKKVIARGSDAVITEDSRYAVFKIKPFFKESRDARIKKKKPDEMPKDSLGIIELGKDSVWKLARVKTFKTPAESYGWLAYHLEKAIEPAPKGRPAGADNKKAADSLTKVIDSLKMVIETMPKKKKKNSDEADDSCTRSYCRCRYRSCIEKYGNWRGKNI